MGTRWTAAPLALLAGLLLGPPLQAAGGDYRIGQPRQAQQGTFCDDAAIADEVAELFVRFGAPTGYAALSASPGCRLKVHDFTPLRLHRTVKVELSTGEHYTVRFIVVAIVAPKSPADGGAPERILVTTRALNP